MKTVEEEVVEVLRLFDPGWSGNLDEAPKLDSLEYLEIMYELEERLGVEFPDEAVDLNTTPRQLVKMIEERKR